MVICVLKGFCVRGFNKVWEEKFVSELCVENRLCVGDWIKLGKSREWWTCVLAADYFRGIV